MQSALNWKTDWMGRKDLVAAKVEFIESISDGAAIHSAARLHTVFSIFNHEFDVFDLNLGATLTSRGLLSSSVERATTFAKYSTDKGRL